MATNFKAADLIGKTIVVGDNQATIVIKSVDGDKLSGEFTKDGTTTPMSFPIGQLQGMTEKGLWRIDNGELKIDNSATVVTTEADVAEANDVMPKVTPKKSEGRRKKEEKPQTSSVKPQTSIPQTSKYVYSTYQTSKGKTGAKITGVSETDDAYQQAAAIHASASYERDKDGNKQFYLCFGPRYAEAAKQVCELLNAGKPIEDAIAIIDKATEERAVKREEWKQKREERRAQTSAASTQTSTEKTYTQSELAEWLRKLNAGDPKAAKFFNDLAKAA